MSWENTQAITFHFQQDLKASLSDTQIEADEINDLG